MVWPMSIPFWTSLRWSCRRPEQLGQPDEVIGCHCQGKLEPQACGSAQHGPGEPADGLAPAERLLGSFALLLTDRVTRVACRASVDRRGAVGRVLRDVRRDVEVAQIVDEITRIVR